MNAHDHGARLVKIFPLGIWAGLDICGRFGRHFRMPR
jgi:hypothetical protein